MSKLTIPDVVDKFQHYHNRNSAWGSLHTVLEDGNIEDKNVLFCIEYAKQNNDIEGLELANILLSMSKTQRKKLPYYISEQYANISSLP